jgi:hypothetical protein
VLPSRNVVSTIRISSINVPCYCGTLPANNNKRNAIRNVPVIARNCFLTDPLAGEYVNAKAQLARPLKKAVSHVSSPSVLTGKIQVFVERQGRALVLTDAGPGTILGELAVLCGIARSASVRASEKSAVLQWSAAAFRSLLLGDPFLSQRIFRESLRTVIEKERSRIESLIQSQRDVKND